MKRVLLAVLFLLLPALAFARTGERELAEVLPDAPAIDSSSQEEVEAYIKDKCLHLYIELLSFKNDPSFLFYGFGRGGQYFQWMEESDALREYSDNAKKAFDVKPTYPDLTPYTASYLIFGLGLNYLSSKGTEEFSTLHSKSDIDEALGIKKYRHE